MLRSRPAKDAPPTLFECRPRTDFAPFHEPAVINYIGCKDDGETVLGAFFDHLVKLRSENATRYCMAVEIKSPSSVLLP